MPKAQKNTSEKVTVVLDHDSDYEHVLYEAGKEYEVDAETAKRLKQINEILKKENN